MIELTLLSLAIGSRTALPDVLLAIEGGSVLLTALLVFGILVVIGTFFGMLWVTYREWQANELW
jgi:hypothetical protein